MTLDIASDFDLWDNQETATYQVIDPAGNVEAEHEVAALRADVSEVATGYQGGIQPATATWHVKRSDLPVSPGRGDRLVTAATGTYVVETYRLMAWGTRWELTTQLLETEGTATP